MATPIAVNLDSVRRRIEAAAHRAGRKAEAVTLIGISKTIPVERIREAALSGLLNIGENRVQEAREKVALLPAGLRWHLVGHLQTNKAALAARLFQVVHSVDSVELLGRLEQAAAREGRRQDALIQIDMAGEATKFGVKESDLDTLLDAAASCRAITVRGLMVLPPYDPDPEKSRPYFRQLRLLRDKAAARHGGLGLTELSMGMTGDFEVAIEEGATMVRIGRAIFGERGGA